MFYIFPPTSTMMINILHLECEMFDCLRIHWLELTSVFIIIDHAVVTNLLIIIIVFIANQTNTCTMDTVCTKSITVLVVPYAHAYRTLSNKSIFVQAAHSHHTDTRSPLFIICLFFTKSIVCAKSFCVCGHLFFFFFIKFNCGGDKYTNTYAGGDEHFILLTKTKWCRISARSQSNGTFKEHRTINISQPENWLVTIAR